MYLTSFIICSALPTIILYCFRIFSVDGFTSTKPHRAGCTANDSDTAVARFAEPLAYTSVNPYLPDMIRDFGIQENEIAKWAGLTSAAFSLAQSVTAVPWGRAADRYGRKPVLILGLLSTMTCFIIWGLSTSLPMAITVRAIQGGGNGNGTLPQRLAVGLNCD